MDSKEFLVTRANGSTETVVAVSAMVGLAGQLEFMRYDDYKEGNTFYGWYMYKVMSPNSWTDMVQVKAIKDESIPQGASVRVYDSEDTGKGGIRDLS